MDGKIKRSEEGGNRENRIRRSREKKKNRKRGGEGKGKEKETNKEGKKWIGREGINRRRESGGVIIKR